MRTPPTLGAPLLGLALLSLLPLAASGCRGGDGESGSAQEETGQSSVSSQEEGQNAEGASHEPITIALPQLPRKFDPLDDLEPWAERISEDLVFEGLVRRTHDAYPWAEPALADRCVVDREYAVASIACHIPPGIRFHDGSEVTMDDIVYSIDYWTDHRRTWIRDRHGLASLRRVEIADTPRGSSDRDPGRWVRIGFDKREALALESLAAIKIVPRASHRGNPGRFAQQPIGTGPMRVVTIQQDRIVLERFDEHHDPERAAVADKMVFKAVADGAEALTALRRGEIHLLPELAPVHAPVELGKPGMSGRFTAWLVSPPHYDMLLWNVVSGVQSGPRLRAALHDALPLSGIAREIHRAPGLAIGAPIDLHEPVEIDLEQLEDIKLGEPVRAGLLALPSIDEDARALTAAALTLDQLEWPIEQGIRRRAKGSLRVTLTWDGHPGRATTTAARIRDTWESIGVVVPQASASWAYLLLLLRKGEFKVAMVHLGGHSDEDLYDAFHSRGANNFSGVDDDLLDAALTEYRGAPDRDARDTAKQRIAARLAQLRVVSVLYAPTAVTLASRRLTGLAFIDDLPRLDRLGLTAGDIDWGG